MRIVINKKDRQPAVKLRDCELEVVHPSNLPEIIVEVSKEVLDDRPDYKLARVLVEDADGKTAVFDLTLLADKNGRAILQTIGRRPGGIDKVVEANAFFTE